MTSTEPWKQLPPSLPLPPLDTQGHVEHDGARIWFGIVGAGRPVVLLHGGSASADTWGNQVPALRAAGRQVVLIDSRGHGRSTRDELPLGYERMEADVIAVMDHLQIAQADVVGWSDGANIGLVIAMKHPQRLANLFAFGANLSTGALKPGAFASPILPLAGERLAQDYRRLSAPPHDFAALRAVVKAMQQVEPNYGVEALHAIRGPRIAIVHAEQEEFIPDEHSEHLAHEIAGARLVRLADVSHFAPWQLPQAFNRAMLEFLDGGGPPVSTPPGTSPRP